MSTNTGHGHVRPRPDGLVAKCGGPHVCGVCLDELLESQAPSIVPDAPAVPAIWIQTLPALGSRQGRALDLIDPKPEQIDFRTIATVLSRVPRFAGQTGGGVLSVAQHCTEGARAILRDTGRNDWAAAFLLHDAHEYAMGDIATPVAQALAHHAEKDLGKGGAVSYAIRSLKSALDSAIYRAAGMSYPLDAQTAALVKLYDARMLVTERNARLAEPPYPHDTQAEPVADVDMFPWSAGSAEAFYWRHCVDLLPVFVDSPRKV